MAQVEIVLNPNGGVDRDASCQGKVSGEDVVKLNPQGQPKWHMCQYWKVQYARHLATTTATTLVATVIVVMAMVGVVTPAAVAALVRSKTVEAPQVQILVVTETVAMTLLIVLLHHCPQVQMHQGMKTVKTFKVWDMCPDYQSSSP